MPADKERTMPFTIFESPFGPLTLVGDSARLRRLYFPGRAPTLDERDHDPRALRAAADQLGQYFAGRRQSFELAMGLEGTPFQCAVWRALAQIRYGSTTTYGALVRELGSEPRAVGAAVGATPIPIIVPCHRVIGADGSLTGYGGGLGRKRALLGFEAGGGDRSAFDTAWRQRQLALL
jgi:methylated-DNA-[protein]-cysteine S-methyltransferase